MEAWGQLQQVLMRHPPQVSVKTCGGRGAVGARGGGGVGGRVGGGGIGSSAARNLLLPHAYLKGVCVCVCVCPGAWGYRGMYAIIAISCLCREESLKGLKD